MSNHQQFGYDDEGDEQDYEEDDREDFCELCGNYEEDCACPLTTDEAIERATNPL